MENEYNTVVPESPIAESLLLNLDMNTEVLSVCESAQHLEDQMRDDYFQEEIVLDSDDEGGDHDEPVTLLNLRFPRKGRLFSGGETAMRKRQKTRAGYFRRVNKNIRRHAFLQTDFATSDRCDKGNNAGSGTTCLYSDSIFRDDIGVMDSILSTSPDQIQIATNAKEFLVGQNVVKECLLDDSLDEINLSSSDSKYINKGKEANPLDYDESQEPADSDNKALGFVDHFLSTSDLVSFKNVDIGKSNRILSPPSLRSKGSQCLARRVGHAHYASNSMAFDWTEKHMENDRYSTLRTNDDKLFGFEDEKSEVLISIEDSNDVNFQNEISSLHSKDNLPGNANDLDTKLLNTHDTVKIDDGLLRLEEKEGKDLQLTLEALDIGLDTQIAAEAMEELLHAAPPSIDPWLSHQGSDNTLMDSSNTVNKGSKLKSAANPEKAFVGWGCKGKRSKCKNIFTVWDKNTHCFAVKSLELPLPVNKKLKAVKVLNSKNPRNSRNSHQRLRCLRGRRCKRATDGSKSGFPTKRRKAADGVREPPFKVKRVISNGEENINLDVAGGVILSKLNSLWTYPKRKRSRLCMVHPPVKLSNQCSPCVATENDGKNKRLSNLLVYKRRGKVSLERGQMKSSLEFASEKLVQIPGELDTANPSRPCGTLDGGELSSFDASNNIKSDEHSSTLQSFESSEKSKQSFNHLSRSPLLKELTKLGYTESLPDFLLKDSRRRRAIKKVCILFSQNLEASILKQQKKIVARLGFSIVSCCSEATHFVADRFVRTGNMLEAIALGKHVVTHFWLESCEQSGYVIDEKRYILRDVKKEKEIGFNMLASLSRASQHPLLQGRRILITPNVRPYVDAISSLVKAVGGRVVQTIQNPKPKDILDPGDLLILSCKEDYTICFPFLEKGAWAYDSELLLNGIVTQKLEYERYQLFKDLAA